jgi:hypothetical protein
MIETPAESQAEPLACTAFDALHFVVAKKVELISTAIAAGDSDCKPTASGSDGLSFQGQVRSSCAIAVGLR